MRLGGPYLITVPLAPPAVVSMTLVVRLTHKSSLSRPSRSAQYSKVWPDWFFRMQPPGATTMINLLRPGHILITI